ncbi:MULTISPECIES: type VII toxin-antitoxin system HepT family RNase toxin [Geobacillus]|uniref:type VII toxin-antitoxin system HepT family RNase toxin n=1 Tax=Geobacillus TaxID=129337 RepID=UPI003D19DD10
MKSDVILNKISVIERCLKRIREEYNGDPKNLQNYTKQDSIVLNLQRACEACIDLAMHIVAEQKFGLPQHSRDAFALLEEHGVISPSISKKMKAMVGFRNIAVHDYQQLNLGILQAIVEQHLDDFKQFAEAILRYAKENN